MTHAPDPLADRVAEWAAEIPDESDKATGELALRGWALCEELRRRGPSASHLFVAVEERLGGMPTDLIPQQVAHAIEAWNCLLSDIDREEPNLEHVRRQTRDVFFSVLDALVLVEDSGGPDEEAAARALFNTVVGDLYVFEPMADVAAELRRQGAGGDTRLSDLLCDGIAGLFDGHAPVRPGAAPEPAVAEFVPFAEFVRDGAAAAGKPLTPAAFAKRMAKVSWWYAKWVAQRLQIAILPKTRDFCVYVWDGDAPTTRGMSRALDGWQVRAGQGREMNTATINAGIAVVKFPDRIDPANFVCQVKGPTANEWSDLFGRAGPR